MQSILYSIKLFTGNGNKPTTYLAGKCQSKTKTQPITKNAALPQRQHRKAEGYYLSVMEFQYRNPILVHLSWVGKYLLLPLCACSFIIWKYWTVGAKRIQQGFQRRGGNSRNHGAILTYYLKNENIVVYIMGVQLLNHHGSQALGPPDTWVTPRYSPIYCCTTCLCRHPLTTAPHGCTSTNPPWLQHMPAMVPTSPHCCSNMHM